MSSHKLDESVSTDWYVDALKQYLGSIGLYSLLMEAGLLENLGCSNWNMEIKSLQAFHS